MTMMMMGLSGSAILGRHRHGDRGQGDMERLGEPRCRHAGTQWRQNGSIIHPMGRRPSAVRPYRAKSPERMMGLSSLDAPAVKVSVDVC